MEAILHKIQNFITGFMLVNSNLAKAVEFIEYGTYISVGVILLGLLGFFGLAKKNNALIKAVGAASLFALFPAWFIIGEMGLIGLLAVIFIVSIVLNRQSPDTRGRNFLLSSMLAGFAISIVSFFIGYNYLKEGHEIDPSENGVYGLAPFMVFLVSFLVFRRRDKKAEIYHNEMEEEPWQMGRELVASASMSSVPSSRVTFEPIEEKRGYPSEEERLPSLEELFSKGAEDGSFETIFSARAEEPAKEAVRAEVEEAVSEGVTELATDQEALSASLISEASAAVAETIETEMTSDLSVGSRSDEIAADLSDTPEGSVAKDIPETLGLQDDLSQTLVLDDLSKQLSEVLGSTKLADEPIEEVVAEETAVEPAAELAEEIDEVEVVKLDFLEPKEEVSEPIEEVVAEETVVEPAAELAEETDEVEVVKLDFLEPKEEVSEPIEEVVAEETVVEPAAELAEEIDEVEVVKLDFLEPKEEVSEPIEEVVAEETVVEPAAELAEEIDEVEVVKLDFLEPKEEVSEPIEEVVAEETVVEPAAEITEEVEEVQPDLLEKQEESAAVAEITEAPTDPDKTLVPDDISEQVSEAIAEVEEEVAGPAAELVETDDRTEEVQAEMIEEELPAEIEEVNAETEEVVAEESVVEPAAELAEEDEVEEVKSELLEPQAEEKEGSSASVGQEVAEAQEEQIDSVLEDLIASLEKLDPKETLEREQRGNIVDYSHVFAQANERAVSMDMMQAAYLGHTINYDVSNITDFKSRFSTPFRTEELPRSEDPIRTNEERSEDKAVIDAKVEQKAQEGKETLKAEQIMEPVSIKEEPLVTKGTKDDVSQALPLHINISGLEDADADIIENDGENIIVSIKLSKKKSKMSVEDVKVERQESDDKGPEKALVAEQNISSGMPKFISLPGVPKFVAMPAIETEAPKVIAGIPKFVGLSGMPKFAAPAIKDQESKEELPQENMIESRVETMEELQMKPEVVAETVETVKEAEVKNEAAAVEPIALHPVEGPKVEAIVEELPYEPKVGTASPNFVKITGVPCFMEGPKEEVVIIEEPIDARPIDEEVESVFTIPVEATEPQLDFMTANGLKLPKVAQNRSDMGMTAQYTKEELGVGGSERSQTPGASQEMGIFCNEQEEYYRSQYYFLKTQVDFYERQKGYYQKQLSVSESQLEFYAQQADMYLKQADFYRVKKKED